MFTCKRAVLVGTFHLIKKHVWCITHDCITSAYRRTNSVS
uniref:Uncharacterized protein n=1 Tax=Arundo donax TaxID=35708 RepID=A0A0A8ZUU5_ARUDO